MVLMVDEICGPHGGQDPLVLMVDEIHVRLL